MPQALRTTIVLVVLVGALVVAGFLGFQRATEPFPGKAVAPKCVPTVVEAGSKVFPEDVTVSVYNASERNGLAGRTINGFVAQGFGEGDTGNAADVEVEFAMIWTESPRSADVRLVASRLGPQTQVERRAGRGVGVTVLVGDDFEQLVKGKKRTVAEDETTICTPPMA